MKCSNLASWSWDMPTRRCCIDIRLWCGSAARGWGFHCNDADRLFSFWRKKDTSYSVWHIIVISTIHTSALEVQDRWGLSFTRLTTRHIFSIPSKCEKDKWHILVENVCVARFALEFELWVIDWRVFRIIPSRFLIPFSGSYKYQLGHLHRATYSLSDIFV